jgi:hypothetical protein
MESSTVIMKTLSAFCVAEVCRTLRHSDGRHHRAGRYADCVSFYLRHASSRDQSLRLLLCNCAALAAVAWTGLQICCHPMAT